MSSRKWVRGLWALLGAGVFAIIILVSFFLYFGGKLDSGSKQYVDNAVLAMSENWNKQEFLDRASVALRGRLSDAQVSEIFLHLAALGKLKKYEGSQGQAHIAFIIGGTSKITADYVATAIYDQGAFKFLINLDFINGEWKIQNLHIQRA